MRNDPQGSIAERLAHIRGHRSQAAFAQVIGIHKNSWGNYERGEREIGAEALTRLAAEGWNINWLLTGEGPERLEALSGAGFSRSQAVRVDGETLRDSVEAVDAALAAMHVDASGAERAALYSAMYEYLASGDASPGQATAAVLRIIQGGRR